MGVVIGSYFSCTPGSLIHFDSINTRHRFVMASGTRFPAFVEIDFTESRLGRCESYTYIMYPPANLIHDASEDFSCWS